MPDRTILTGTMMRILSIKAENFKGVKLVEIEPGETTTLVGGKNRQGKSSFLDAIAATLGGVKLCPKRPIRDGETEAKCEIRLEGEQARMLPPCTVTRTWKPRKNGGIKSELEILTEDGYRAPTPQTILDDIVGPLGFDPERFLRMKPKEQAEVLRKLVGLDFSELDTEHQKAYDKRTEVNRTSKTMKARFDAMPQHEDAPEKEVSVSALMTELQRRQAVNKRNEEVRDELGNLQGEINAREDHIRSAEEVATTLESQLQEAKGRVETLKNQKAANALEIKVKLVEVHDLEDADESEIQQQVTESDTVNNKVRENAARVNLEIEVEVERKKSATLTDKIKDIDATKQKMREGAEWPVAELGYDDEGVTLFGRPFDQASATEQREAAFGIVAADNPSLKFAMIKDGSLLDDESLADFSRLAAERGFQLFVERVGEDKECTIIISEGEVVSKEDE